MEFPVILVLLIFSASVVQAGEHRAVWPIEKIRAVKGSEAILPCHLEPREDLEKFDLDWRKGPEVAYAYQHGWEDRWSQASQFRDRMSVDPEGLKNGNLSLKISSVQLSDHGTYRCFILEPAASSTDKFRYVKLIVVGKPQAVCPDKKIKAVKGSEVILPCHAEPSVNLENHTLNWIHASQAAYAYRRRQEDHQLQNPKFRGRTSVDLEGLKTGNLSLKISSVKLSDQGKYRCFVRPHDPCTVELVVDESSGGRGDDSSTAEPPVMTAGGGDMERGRRERP